MTNLIFFLGGKDAEMVTIENVLANAGAEFVNKNLGWGARAAAYESEIHEAISAGKTPVLIELSNAPGKDWNGNPYPVIEIPAGCIEVDHHGDRSNEPAAIIQVCELLGANPTRHHLLIAANDTGYIPGMKAAGATEKEIEEIRALDRSCQGITAEHEAEAIRALNSAEEVGDCKVVFMNHSKSAPVTDRMFGKQPKGQNILIVSVYTGKNEEGELVTKKELNYYGDGALCARLKKEFGGWAGGSGLGQKGGNAYYGTTTLAAALNAVLTAQV